MSPRMEQSNDDGWSDDPDGRDERRGKFARKQKHRQGRPEGDKFERRMKRGLRSLKDDDEYEAFEESTGLTGSGAEYDASSDE